MIREHLGPASGFSASSRATSACARSRSFLLVGPRLEPPELVASQPLSPAAEGRGWNQAGEVNGWAISSEPTTLPLSSVTVLPLARRLKKSSERPVQSSG